MPIEQKTNPSQYDMPKPTRVVIIDDLSSVNPGAKDASLVCELTKLIDSPNQALCLTTNILSQRLKRKYLQQLELGKIIAPQLIISIGAAGEQVAIRLGINTPRIRVNPIRKRDPEGTRYITSKTGLTLTDEITQSLSSYPPVNCSNILSVGIVDDTIFSGKTIEAVSKATTQIFPRAKIFAMVLTCVKPRSENTLRDNNVMPIAALTLTTNPNKTAGLNSIDAKDFISPDALQLAQTSIPFMAEQNWMRSWFGNNYPRAMAICSQLTRILDRWDDR